MTIDEMRAYIERVFKTINVVNEITDKGGHGLVRWARPLPRFGTEYIVHRWATTYSNDQPVQTEDGILFWSGGYYFGDDAEERAKEDFEVRKEWV